MGPFIDADSKDAQSLAIPVIAGADSSASPATLQDLFFHWLQMLLDETRGLPVKLVLVPSTRGTLPVFTGGENDDVSS